MSERVFSLSLVLRSSVLAVRQRIYLAEWQQPGQRQLSGSPCVSNVKVEGAVVWGDPVVLLPRSSLTLARALGSLPVHAQLSNKDGISLWPGVLENNLSGPNRSSYQRLKFCHFVRHGIGTVITVSGLGLTLGLHKNQASNKSRGCGQLHG